MDKGWALITLTIGDLLKIIFDKVTQFRFNLIKENSLYFCSEFYYKRYLITLQISLINNIWEVIYDNDFLKSWDPFMLLKKGEMK